jgi:hypothetical protein
MEMLPGGKGEKLSQQWRELKAFYTCITQIKGTELKINNNVMAVGL